MVVFILERVSSSLRGEITRWMIEPHTGIFLGTISAAVREKLWQKICSKTKDGGCIMIYSAQKEQGFDVEFWGATKRNIIDYEGLKLVHIPKK